jgi:hypothetical protein
VESLPSLACFPTNDKDNLLTLKDDVSSRQFIPYFFFPFLLINNQNNNNQGRRFGSGRLGVETN